MKKAGGCVFIIINFSRFYTHTHTHTHTHLSCLYRELPMKAPLNLNIKGVYGRSKQLVMIFMFEKCGV